MTDSEKPRHRVRAYGVPSEVSAPTLDSYQNFEARIGHGTDNVASGGSYGFNPVSRNRQLLEWMYRSSPVVGRIVDRPAEDMVRAGIDLASTLPPGDGEKVLAAFQRLQLWKALEDCMKWGRLYGGAIGIIMIDGQDPSTPLRLETIGRGQFRGVLALDRWMVQPTFNNLVDEPGPDLGRPRFYVPNANAPAFQNTYVHHTRVIRFVGVEQPYWQAQAENTWGTSVVERLYDRLLAFDSTTQGVAQLVFKAHLRILKVEGLIEDLALGGPKAVEALAKRVEAIRRFQSIEGLTLLDAKDDFDTQSYTFSGLSDVLAQFMLQLSMASGIPIVILFGQSPAGFSTGETDIRNYYDSINTEQESRLRPGMARLLEVVVRSETGRPPPEGFGFTFEPLWQLSDKEKADIAKTITDTVLAAEEAGILPPGLALKELRQSADITGIWTNITDEHIAAAEAAPPPMGEGAEAAEGGDPDEPDPPPGDFGEEGKARDAGWRLSAFLRGRRRDVPALPAAA